MLRFGPSPGIFQNLTYSPGSTSGFRVNIGVATGPAISVDLLFKLYGDAGELLGTKAQHLRLFEHSQLTKTHQLVGTPAVARGCASVQMTTTNRAAKVHAYGRLMDNITPGLPICRWGSSDTGVRHEAWARTSSGGRAPERSGALTNSFRAAPSTAAQADPNLQCPQARDRLTCI